MELKREIPVSDGWDVIVVGGGPAGCGAATAAARDGARTLLLEATGCLGGMGTSGLVTTWAPFDDGEGRCLYGGLAERLLNETRAAMPHVDPERLSWVPFRAEDLKRACDRMVLEAGAEVLFGQTLCGVETCQGGAVEALVVASKAGLVAYQARVYVDATGDGDLAAFAGAEFAKGDDAGDLQPASLCFLMAGVDDPAYAQTHLHPNNIESPVYEIMKSEAYPHVRDPHCCNDRNGPGVVSFNAGHVWNVDATDPASVTRGLVEGRRVAADMARGLQDLVPQAFGQAFLVQTAPSLGIRETRRIVGDYELTVEDYMARAHFPDEIGVSNYWIDIHTAEDEIAESAKGHGHVQDRFEHYGPGQTHGIPYRCLTPKGLSNVLVAGRAISCDRPVQGAIRVMPACLVTGEAAGAAAAMVCGSSTVDVHAVDTDTLRARLKDAGAYLP